MKHNIFTNPFKKTTTRTTLSVLLLFVIMIVILFYLSQNYRSNLIDFRKNELKRQVEISLNTIEPIIEELRMQNITREEALTEVVKLVRRMTYTGEIMDNYIFMSSYEGIMLVQPLEPQKQDTFQLNVQDSYGNYLIQDLIKTAQSPEGYGFVSYFYPPPGATTPGEKLSYVKGIPELGCYIGTGMFFDDIDELFNEYLLGPLVIIMISLSVVYMLVILYMRPLLKCFQFLHNTFHLISLNPDVVPEIPFDSFPGDSDEHDILTGFEDMIERIEQSRIELRNSEKRYRYLYEESVGVRIIVSNDGIISGVNDSFLRTLGYPAGFFDGKNLHEIFGLEQHLRIEGMMKTTFSGSYNEALDLDLPDSSGVNRTILISDVLKVPEDQTKILMTGVDITNRKIAERRAAIQNEQLIHADKLASLGVLVSGVAHEINNPNQFILSNASLMEDIWHDSQPILDEYYKENGDFLIQGLQYSEMKKHVPEYLKGMTEGARRIGKIVSDLKTLSRNDSGQSWSAVDINAALGASVNLCSNMIKKATDYFELQLADNLPSVHGSSQQLEQVFINLIQNAVQSLKDKTKKIKISSCITRNYIIKISIDDEGCGIQPDDLKRVYDPFYTTKRETGGTGIGLSISKSIIDEHRGILKYKSEPSLGTLVEVYLKPAEAKTKDENNV